MQPLCIKRYVPTRRRQLVLTFSLQPHPEIKLTNSGNERVVAGGLSEHSMTLLCVLTCMHIRLALQRSVVAFTPRANGSASAVNMGRFNGFGQAHGITARLAGAITIRC